ncbi:MAG: amino acid adenylation domain-containing protein [Xanthomonadaceae bacterium]|nr:amino acid adenylation domain-containing protein [Xanthomonadaceae bacterium]
MNDLEQRFAGLSPEKRALLQQAAARGRTTRSRIGRESRPERIPLSAGQRRLWLLDRFSPGLLAYNMAKGLWLEGPLDQTALRAALQAVFERHEVLRTVYRSEAGLTWQHVLDDALVPWHEVDAQGDDAVARHASALRLARDAVAIPFAIDREPPIRAHLVRLDPERHLLVLAFHHIAIDGWSLTTLVDEFADCYARRCAGDASPLPEPELQMADLALWQARNHDGEGLDRALDYWRSRLADAPAMLDLPSDRPRPSVQSFRGHAFTTVMSQALQERVDAYARERKVTPSTVLFVVLQLLLARYSGQDRVVASMGHAGRTRFELEPMIGFFINLLPLVADVGDEPSFDTLLARAQAEMLQALEHADAPLDRILESLRVARSASYTPFAQVMYFFQNYPAHDVRLPNLRTEALHWSELRPPTAQGDLLLFVNQHAPGELMFEYSTDLYDAATIERMAGHFVTLLEGVLDSPQRPVSQLPLMTRDEIMALARWNDTARPLPGDATIAAQVSAQVARTPDATALAYGDRAISYRELDLRANAVAHALRAGGVGAGALVGLFVERSPAMVIGLLGILKAGGAYVPLDPAYPQDRLAYMMELSGSRVIVTQPELRGRLPVAVPSVVEVDDAAAIDGLPSAPPADGAGPEDPAYVIFTSGSTGKPKGVEIRQRSAVNLIRSIAREPGMSADDTICAISTLSFDIALTELVVPLTVGARILLVDRDTVRDGLRLRRFIESARPTLMQATPATWRMLLDVGWPGDPAMRIISTGEALPRELADRLLPMARELWNLYGPTETTVYSALCRVEPGEGPILVGRPVDNTVIHIVDRRMQPLPVGLPGELLIGGDGLAAGYRGRPDLTVEKFIPDPYSAQPGARLYRTGDLAFWRGDGTIQVIGRIDHQIKLRGFRIELGEIESVLAQWPGMRQVVVHCREDVPGDRRLVAYYVCDADGSGAAVPDAAALRTYLGHSLPDYMVPSAFVALEAFPLTPNGKIDRGALPPPGIPAGQGEIVAPRTPEEAWLAALWKELLALPSVDVRAGFFDLGGHSVLATRMLSRVSNEYGIELPLRVLFEAPTLEGFAARVVAACEEEDRRHMEALLLEFENLSEDEVAQRLSGQDGAGTA